MIHWQWVIAAFLIGVTLTLCLEIRRQRQLKKTTLFLYLLPVISILIAVGIGLTDNETAASHVETAVIISPQMPTPQPTTNPKQLPSPQVSLHEAVISPQIDSVPTAKPPQTAVHHIQIPALNLNKSVHTIPLDDGIWNVATLGSDVGWLETTAVHPDDEQAMVFVGHMTFANSNLLEQGAFADIPALPYGSAVILETEEGTHTYLVDSVRRVSPDNTDALYQEPGNTIILLTCADWNPQAGVYENRLLVRASREQPDPNSEN